MVLVYNPFNKLLQTHTGVWAPPKIKFRVASPLISSMTSRHGAQSFGVSRHLSFTSHLFVATGTHILPRPFEANWCHPLLQHFVLWMTPQFHPLPHFIQGGDSLSPALNYSEAWFCHPQRLSGGVCPFGDFLLGLYVVLWCAEQHPSTMPFPVLPMELFRYAYVPLVLSKYVHYILGSPLNALAGLFQKSVQCLEKNGNSPCPERSNCGKIACSGIC